MFKTLPVFSLQGINTCLPVNVYDVFFLYYIDKLLRCLLPLLIRFTCIIEGVVLFLARLPSGVYFEDGSEFTSSIFEFYVSYLSA